MSVATVAQNKSGKKPHYKNYVSFLENYKNSRTEHHEITASDSGVGLSLNNSSNNSSSSVCSDMADAPKNSFKEYLENYNNKRYSSVQPPSKINMEPKTVKTEVYIEINNPPSTISKTVEVNNGNNVSNVSKVSKMFEKTPAHTENSVIKSTITNGKVNTFNFDQKDGKAATPVVSRKIQGNLNKIPLKKSNSISEKSRVFEDTNGQAQLQKNCCTSPKPVINTVKPVIAPKFVNGDKETNGHTSPKPPMNIKPVIIPKAVTEALVANQKQDCTVPKIDVEPINNLKVEVTLPIQNALEKLPPPPPPPFPQNPPQEKTVPVFSKTPPPPPLPPVNFAVKKAQNPSLKSSLPVKSVKKADVVDGIAPIVDKNDPRVKKLVYGALREMYGAYHDKANDYIATLPRNRVKKNNGLDSIINSIASQGGLEKLNGRVNPSVETD